MKGKESGLHSHWDAWDFIFSEAPRPGLEATQLNGGRITGSKADRLCCDHSLPPGDELKWVQLSVHCRLWLQGALLYEAQGLFCLWLYFFMVQQSVADQGLLTVEVSRSQSDIPHSTIVDEWSSRDRDIYLATLTRYRLPYPRRDSNPQAQQASGRRPTPYRLTLPKFKWMIFKTHQNRWVLCTDRLLFT